MLELVRRTVLPFFLGILLVVAPRVARAADDAPIDPKSIPEPLRPWTTWAVHGSEDALCPTLHGLAGGAPRCAWPSRLDLVLDEKKGSFSQTWHVDARRAVPLPGDDKRWPLDVKVDGKRTVVVPHEGVPTVALDRGEHVVTGGFAWDSLPESLQVPQETALLGLVLRGARVDQPNREANGTVWLQKTLEAEEGERLDFVVHRRVVDEVPMLLTTRIVLNVAGRNREVVLGKTLPSGFVPMALESQLPARVEPDTRLRVQVRPGTWTIELVARSEGPVAALSRPKPEGPWREGDEVWVFDARSNLRLVDVEGVAAIDPQQTSLPEEWKRLPAYPLGLGSVLRLVEKRRGNAQPPPDHLALQRTLWLDFDGHGFTASDTLTGDLRRASRLEMLPPMVLGRVAIGGKDQFITHLEGDAAKTGVEVRQGQLTVTADSRLVADPSDMPAVGWNHDLYEMSATLYLPPGYRIFHATGIDDVPSTWWKHWTLLELFLVLVLAIGVWRLYGRAWGAVAVATFTLTFPEAGAPKVILILVLASEALVRAASRAVQASETPPSRGLVLVRKALGGARAVAATVLVLVALPFLVEHVRHGLFPALAAEERGDSGIDQLEPTLAKRGAFQHESPKAVDAPAAPPVAAFAPVEDAKKQGAQANAEKEKDADEGNVNKLAKTANTKAAPSATGRWASSVSGSSSDYRQSNAFVYDPNSMVQTGPGRPRWSFTEVPLRWSGPVERGQRLHLYLLSPVENALLAVLRALLVVAIVLRLLPVRPRRTRGDGGRTRLAFVAASLALFVLFAPRAANAQTIPSKEMLEELASRMLQKPACLPTCASSSRMFIEAHPASLRLRIEIEASAPTAIPLPGSSQWSPENVLLDGKPARALLRTEDGRVWLAVEKGWHQASVEGRLPDRELVQLALPLKPHRVEAQAEGWRVEGIHEDGLADDNLQLTRIRGRAGAEAALEQGVLPPFVRVERTLLVGLDWQVATRVVRMSPPGTAVVLEVPLLRGESVTTADLRVVGGKALLNMPPQAMEVTWRSVLDQRSPIVLTAPKSAGWTELWRLDMSPIWHVEIAGLAVVQAEPSATLPEWRPWPGETARLDVSRPDGVSGRTLTIDESQYELRPGLRATDATLTLQVRSSRGAQHVVTLPDGAELESVTIAGKLAPIRQEGRKVTLPVAPGAQSVVVKWRMSEGIAWSFHAPDVDLGAPSVNVTTTIVVPEGRWVLALRGPRLGPVVLFWSLLAVLLVVAGAIGAMRRTPLGAWQWGLLVAGLSQIHVVGAAFVVLWLHAVAWRERTPDVQRQLFNARQVGLVLATAIALVLLLVAVERGLLGLPDMQVSGNGSTASQLNWFTDRAESTLGGPLVVSVPTLVYRGAMLAWALWLALAVVRWLKWSWAAFGTGALWKRPPPPPPPPQAPHRTPAPPAPEAPPNVAPPAAQT